MLPCDASLKWGSGSLGSGKRQKRSAFTEKHRHAKHWNALFEYVGITHSKKSKK